MGIIKYLNSQQLFSDSLSFTYMEINFQKEKNIILMCLCYHVITEICAE